MLTVTLGISGFHIIMVSKVLEVAFLEVEQINSKRKTLSEEIILIEKKMAIELLNNKSYVKELLLLTITFTFISEHTN